MTLSSGPTYHTREDIRKVTTTFVISDIAKRAVFHLSISVAKALWAFVAVANMIP